MNTERVVTGATGAALVVFAVWIGPIHGLRLSAQPDAAISVIPSGPKFEVASIKTAAQPANHIGISANVARTEIGNWSIVQLIAKAYRIQPYQLVGAEDLGMPRFDIQATLPSGSSPKQIPEMLRWLLAERFGLVVHAETKQLRGYTLAVARAGVKMKAASADSDTARVESDADILDDLFGAGEAAGFSGFHYLPNGELRLEFQKLSMRALAVFLSADLRVPVADRTGLEGRYRAALEFDPATVSNQSPSTDSSGGDLFQAVNRLGLRLERQTVSCSVLVIDHVERVPTAN